MPQEIHRKLEDVPENVKTLFRTVQASEETEEFSHGDYVALYNSDGTSRNEHRWIRVGRYDEIEDKVRTEYRLNYETATEKLGAAVNFTARNPEKTDSKKVKIPEKIYEEASESLNEAF